MGAKIVKLDCMVCGTEFDGPEPQMCCSGRDCGCMGLPTEPIICSSKCYYNLPMFNRLTDNERSELIAKAEGYTPGEAEAQLEEDLREAEKEQFTGLKGFNYEKDDTETT